VTGIGAALWDRMFGDPRPARLHPFVALEGPRHSAPSTPEDLLFHVRAHRADLCFELAQRITERLAGLAHVVDELHGFRSFDERDLLGFVDGTSWDALPVEQQELAVGRTKLSDLEMADDVKPPNSHVALNTIVDADGEERQIVRATCPSAASGSGNSGPTSSATPPTPE
jgi:porphyrinogen peroxidase